MSEHDIQAQAVAYLNEVLPGNPLFAIPNGGQRHIATAMKLKREGVRPGVPDLMLPLSRGGYSGLFIEVKDGKKGVVSALQKEWLQHLSNEVYCVAVCRSVDEIVDMVTWYCGLAKPKAKASPLKGVK